MIPKDSEYTRNLFPVDVYFTLPGARLTLIESLGEPEFALFQRVGLASEYIDDGWLDGAEQFIVCRISASFYLDRSVRLRPIWLYKICTELNSNGEDKEDWELVEWVDDMNTKEY